MEEEPITFESVKKDGDFSRLIPKDIQEAFLPLSSDNVVEHSMLVLKPWLLERLSDKHQSEDFRIIVLRMLVCIGKGDDWLREKLCEVVTQRQFEWYFRSLIMSAFVDYWPHEPWMRDIFRALLDDRHEDNFVRTGAECRLSCFWTNDDWLPERLREIVLNPKEDGETQFNAIRSMAEYWKDSPWLRTTLEAVMFSQKHNIEPRGQAAFRLLKVFGQTEWLQGHFEKILSDREHGDSRLEFLRIVCENWKDPIWVEDHVVEMVFDRKNKVYMRSEALNFLSKVWSENEKTRTKLAAFFEDKRQNMELRYQIRQMLGIPYHGE